MIKLRVCLVIRSQSFEELYHSLNSFSALKQPFHNNAIPTMQYKTQRAPVFSVMVCGPSVKWAWVHDILTHEIKRHNVTLLWNSRDIKLQQLKSKTFTKSLHGKLWCSVHIIKHHTCTHKHTHIIMTDAVHWTLCVWVITDDDDDDETHTHTHMRLHVYPAAPWHCWWWWCVQSVSSSYQASPL